MYTVLVTGVGAIIGYGIIKSLRASKYSVKIVGIDIFSDAIGQKWCDEFEQGILASDPNFPEFIAGLIEKHNVNLVIPGIEQDIMAFDKNKSFFEKLNTKIVLNNTELLNLASDKWKMHLRMNELGLPTIPSFTSGDFTKISEVTGVPMLLKPRKSYASKGIHKLYNDVDFNYWKHKIDDNFMVQKIIGTNEEEYTVGSFVSANGENQQIIFRRKLSGEGATAKAEVVNNEHLSDYVNTLIKHFRPVGPTNFQFRYENGIYYLLEINPRISSSTSLRTAFGFNEAEMCIEYYLENNSPKVRNLKYGNAVRYIEDSIEYDSNYI